MPEPVLEQTPDEVSHELLRRAREVSPTALDALTGAVIVLGYHEVDRLAHDPRAAGVGLTFFDFMGIPDGELRRWYGSLMFTNEGPAHHRLRRLVARAFTPRAVERHRALAAELTAHRLARVAHHGDGDLVVEFGDVPIAVICRLLGVPDEQVPEFLAYGDALSPVFGLMDANQIDTASNALGGLMADVDRMIADRQGGGSDDLISALIAAEEDDDRLTHEEVVTIVGNLIVGGHDTTASQASCTLLTLLRHPDVVDDLRGGATRVADVVNETIRFEPSLGVVPRTLLDTVEIGGIDRPAGSMVFLSTASANRDREVWRDPDVVRPSRFAADDAPRLLSFGSGAHYCLGAALARMTLEEVTNGFAAVAPQVHPEFDLGDVEWRSVLGRSPVSLPVSMTTP